MKRKYKQLLVLCITIGALFTLSGCSVPTDVNETTGEKEIRLITTETTFSEVQQTEGWFETFLVYPLSQTINKLSPSITVPGAIALVTFLVNAIVFAFTFKSTLASQKLQLMQPEINKITEKYKGKTDQTSRMAQAQEQQKLYQKYGINPLSSIVVQFIQLPIIFSIYHAVQRSEAVQHGTFLGMDLAVSPVNGFTNGNFVYLILLILVMVFQFASIKLPTYLAERQAKKEAEEQGRRYRPSPNPTAKMMNYMLIMILGMTFILPSGMGIYWICSSIVQIIKALLTQHLTQKEKAKG
ncbi:MAG: membrane protein insertase YidC [Anaerorhabdus sp.]